MGEELKSEYTNTTKTFVYQNIRRNKLINKSDISFKNVKQESPRRATLIQLASIDFVGEKKSLTEEL